jgi:hypothetical protein
VPSPVSTELLPGGSHAPNDGTMMIARTEQMPGIDGSLDGGLLRAKGEAKGDPGWAARK